MVERMGLFSGLFGPDIRKLLGEEQYDEIKKLASTDKRIAPKIIQQLNSIHTHMRERAADLLGDMNEPRAIPELVRVVKRGIDANRPIALQYGYDVSQYIDVDRYIDTKGFERTIPLFDWIFQDYKGSDKEDVIAAKDALTKIMYSSDLKPLFVALGDNNAEVREKVSEILMKRSSKIHQSDIESAIKELITVSEQDKNLIVRRNARLALRNMGSRAVEPLIVALNDKDPLRRWGVAWTLY